MASPDDARLEVSGPDSWLDVRLNAELNRFNVRATGIDDQHELTVTAKTGEELVAGLSGWTWGTSAGIAMLWVREDSRHQGWGARLLTAAEQAARERGCLQLSVSSFTFQAPGFYQRHGYVEIGRTEGIPGEGAADVHMLKRLG